MASPGLHRVLAIEGLRVAKAEHVHAFDLRVIDVVRHFLTATKAPIARDNVEAAAFVVYQCVRATMLAYLLERPAGLDAEGLIEELSNLVTGYLLGGGESDTGREGEGRAPKPQSRRGRMSPRLSCTDPRATYVASSRRSSCSTPWG